MKRLLDRLMEESKETLALLYFAYRFHPDGIVTTSSFIKTPGLMRDYFDFKAISDIDPNDKAQLSKAGLRAAKKLKGFFGLVEATHPDSIVHCTIHNREVNRMDYDHFLQILKEMQ